MIYCASMGNSVAQFVTVTLIFVLVLAITYFTTRWIGSYQKKKMSYGNIQVIESMRLSNNKILEIVKAGNKCVLIAVCKDTVTYLGEVDEETLEFKKPENNESFGTVFNRFRFSGRKEADDEEEK